jgi:SAM-dependent methyltransferase
MTPPKWNELTLELKNEYTMGNTIGLENWYWDESAGGKHDTFTKQDIDRFIACAKNKKTDCGTYGWTDIWLHEAFELVPIEGQSVAIMGSTRPWYESMTIAYGGLPTTVEYNLPNYGYPLIKEILLTELLTSDQKFDVGISISSFEHDGLGRYGDPLNPNGDLRAMKEMKKILKQDGLLFLAVPTGLDKIVWNAHRIYGNKRLKLLMEGWEPVGTVGFDENMLFTDTKEGGAYQPIIVLRNT